MIQNISDVTSVWTLKFMTWVLHQANTVFTGGSAQSITKLQYFFNIILLNLKREMPNGFKHYALKLLFSIGSVC